MTDITADTCPECGSEWDDHTLRDFRAHRPGVIDHPYEEGPGIRTMSTGDIFDLVTFVGGSVDVGPTAAAAGLPRFLPFIRFEFRSSSAPLADPVAASLVLPLEVLGLFRSNLTAAVESARRAALTRRP